MSRQARRRLFAETLEPRLLLAAVNFVEGNQTLGTYVSRDFAVGDLDGDGDLDAIVANVGRTNQANRVLLNNGAGAFSDSGQVLGDHTSYRVSLGDLDGDGDLDAFVGNTDGANRSWLNDGTGTFSDSGQRLGTLWTAAVSLGDLDGDGDLDAFVGNGQNYESDRVWLNDGSGRFSDSGQSLGDSRSRRLSLGDLDGDGDLDAFVVSASQDGNHVWLNDGVGRFTDNGQVLASHHNSDIALGDLDGDGDLDAFVTSAYQGEVNRIWLNDGNGQFTDSGYGVKIGSQRSSSVSLGDLDGDGDLDAFVGNLFGDADRAYLNSGGRFIASEQSLGDHDSYAVSLGDVDGDGDLDAFVLEYRANRVWLNQTPSAPTATVTLNVDNTEVPEAGIATVTATLSVAVTQTVTVDLGYTGTATSGVDYTTPSTQIVVAAGSLTGTSRITVVQDTLDEPDETVNIDIAGVTNAEEEGIEQVTITILDDDEPPMVTLALSNPVIAENGGVATFTATLSSPSTFPVAVDLGSSGTATLTDDYMISAAQFVIPAGEITGFVTATAVDDPFAEDDETVTIDITAVTNGTESGVQQQTATIIDDDGPPGLLVTSLAQTDSGFVAQFSHEFDMSTLNLYDTQPAGLGPPDVVLQGATSGPVVGSLIIDSSHENVTFIKSGGSLEPDIYTVTLRSATDGFKDVSGNLLDGNGDGIVGDDYTSTFTVAEPATNSINIGLHDFVRGPGQDVNLPADGDTGIPLSISEGTNVRAIDLRISYNPALLNITGATVGADMPAGASVIVNTNTPGLAILVFFSSSSLPAGISTFVNLQANVPATDPNGVYGKQQVLDIHSVTISDGNDNEFAVIADDALQLASYFADVSGNGRINASDAAQVARFAALIDTGFASSLLTDPIIVGNVSGNRRINAADASRVAQFAALIDVPEIPPIPGAIAAADGKDAGGFGSLVLLEHQQAPKAETDNEVAEPSAAVSSWERLPNHPVAVDTVLALPTELTAGEADEEGALALEEVMDVLFSLPDEVFHPKS